MTDAGPATPVDDVFFTGQRRSSPTVPFPVRPGGGSVGDTPGHTIILAGDDPEPPQQTDPCADPHTARDWNGDAAAAEALRRMIAAAASQNDPTHNLANREYGAMICQGSNGDLSISPVQWGDPIFDAEGNWINPGEQPSVNVNFNACGAGSIPLAMIHSHPSTGPSGAIPSRPDATWVGAINMARGDNQGRIYVASIGANGSFRIEIYNNTNVSQGSEHGTPGPEVNPDGQPCPGVIIG